VLILSGISAVVLFMLVLTDTAAGALTAVNSKLPDQDILPLLCLPIEACRESRLGADQPRPAVIQAEANCLGKQIKALLRRPTGDPIPTVQRLTARPTKASGI
jgi:hypothetical protein